tara:strand:- start:1720 stop:2421 length:702 start_codon:yes stop_codon:yes gene_type:complete
MNQIISQHGWGLDKNIWNAFKKQSQKIGWQWQDNERGYFSQKSENLQWLNSSSSSAKILICHSLGTHLLESKIVLEATHIVLINSFNNFIPNNSDRKLILKSLKRMEQKIKNNEIEKLIEDFLVRSFMPNPVETHFKDFFKSNNLIVNHRLLLNDLNELYIENRDVKLFPDKSKLLLIQSKNDFILNAESHIDFVSFLKESQCKMPSIIELEKQGHILTNINLIKIIKDWMSE